MGVYTLVYVVVFIIQQQQIKRQKSVIEAMEKFVSIFKVDEVEKYVQLSKKTYAMEVQEKLKEDLHAQLGNVSEKISEEVIQKITDEYQKKVDEVITHYEKRDEVIQARYWEFIQVGAQIVMTVKEEEREAFIKANFPVNQELLLEVIKQKGLFPPEEKKEDKTD